MLFDMIPWFTAHRWIRSWKSMHLFLEHGNQCSVFLDALLYDRIVRQSIQRQACIHFIFFLSTISYANSTLYAILRLYDYIIFYLSKFVICSAREVFLLSQLAPLSKLVVWERDYSACKTILLIKKWRVGNKNYVFILRAQSWKCCASPNFWPS